MMTPQVLREAAIELDVPPGVHRIDVRTSHDRSSLLGVARNVLDLGIFRPAGYEIRFALIEVRRASRTRMRPMRR
jgi:hypothetical protein